MTIFQVFVILSYNGKIEPALDGVFASQNGARNFIEEQLKRSERMNQYMLGDAEYVIVESPVTYSRKFTKKLEPSRSDQ